jgi:hypothetical protein
VRLKRTNNPSYLLIIDYITIHPKFRGLGIAKAAIHRTIGIFVTGCGLVACKPWPLQFTPSVADSSIGALARLTAHRKIKFAASTRGITHILGADVFTWK